MHLTPLLGLVPRIKLHLGKSVASLAAFELLLPLIQRLHLALGGLLVGLLGGISSLDLSPLRTGEASGDILVGANLGGLASGGEGCGGGAGGGGRGGDDESAGAGEGGQGEDGGELHD